MTTYSVKCYENQNTRDCFTFGYAEGDPLTLVTEFDVEAFTVKDAAEAAFTLGNHMGDQNAPTWPTTARSMSKGDVIEVSTPDSTPVRLACASCGWEEIA